MTTEEITVAVRTLDQDEQKRLLLALLKELMPKVCTDAACLDKIRDFVDEETVRNYREQHMDGI